MAEHLIRVTISGVHIGQTIQNVIHFKIDGVRSTNCQGLAEDVRNTFCPLMQPILHNNFRFVQVAAAEIRTLTPIAAGIAVTNLPGTGSTGEAHLPSSFKVRWETLRGGRRGFGKMYFGGISWSLTQGGNQITQTGLDRLTAFLAGIESRYMNPNFDPIGAKMVLVHKDANDPPDDIIGASIYPVIGIQRRRNKLVGI